MLLAHVMPATTQSGAQPDSVKRFAVVSVKPCEPDKAGSPEEFLELLAVTPPSPNRYYQACSNVRQLAAFAYGCLTRSSSTRRRRASSSMKSTVARLPRSVSTTCGCWSGSSSSIVLVSRRTQSRRCWTPTHSRSRAPTEPLGQVRSRPQSTAHQAWSKGRARHRRARSAREPGGSGTASLRRSTGNDAGAVRPVTPEACPRRDHRWHRVGRRLRLHAFLRSGRLRERYLID